MSLVICSNKTEEGGQVASSIYKPWSFRNDLSSNLTLPADCQVALQSAKISMDGTISLGERHSRRFYWYFGGAADGSMGTVSPFYADDAGETTSGVVEVILFQNVQGRVSTDILGLAQELQIELNRACFHPNLHGRILVDPDFDGTTKEFKGFKFTFAESISAPSGAAYAPTNSINGKPAYSDTRNLIDGLWGSQRNHQLNATHPFGPRLAPVRAPPYTTARNVLLTTDMGFTVNAVEARPQSVILNVPPLNLKGGIAAFHFEGVNGFGVPTCRFAAGLTRPSVLRTAPNRGLIAPEWYKFGNGARGPGWLNYFDFCVACNRIGDEPGLPGSANFLRLFHTVRNEDDQGGNVASTSLAWKQLLKLQDIAYGDGTGGSNNTGTSAAIVGSTNFSNDFGYNMSDNSLNITGVLFQVDGQRVKVQLYDNDLSVAHTKYTLFEYDATRNKNLNLKAIGQTEWALLPQFTISNNGSAGSGQIGVFERFDGVDLNWPEWDITQNQLRDRDPLNQARNYGDTSWELTQMGLGGGAGIRQLASEIMERYMFDYSAAGGGGAATTFIYDVMAAGPQSNFTRQKQILITGSMAAENAPAAAAYMWQNYPRAWGANAKGLLGFQGRPIVDFSTFDAVTNYNWEVTSVKIPDILPTSSIFVRLHGFNQESTNARARGKSDIIAHLPRFDGLHSEGPLYLEPNNMVYIDLKNPAPVKVNAFDLSLCYVDEQYARGLTGTTILVLHFREKPK